MDLSSFFNLLGIWGVSLILFAETAFLPAFFLPGDTLLFSVGYFIQEGKIYITSAIIILGLAAFLANITAYFLGRLAEKRIHKYANTHGVKLKKAFDKTYMFYQRFGLLTLFFGRFIPVVRTVAPFLAGVMKLPFFSYAFVSLASGFFWVMVGLSIGSFLGKAAPNLDELMTFIMVGVVVVALVPVFTSTKKWFKK